MMKKINQTKLSGEAIDKMIEQLKQATAGLRENTDRLLKLLKKPDAPE